MVKPGKHHRAADQSNTGPTYHSALRHRHTYARPSQSCTMHEHGHKGARHGMGRHDSSDSEGGTGEKPLGARTTTHTTRPKTPLGSVGGHRPEEDCHRRCCTYITNTWDHGSDSAGRNRVKPETEMRMRPGPNSRGRQISVLLAGTGGGSSEDTDHHIDRTTTSTHTTD